jgi:hypothetical protein
VQRCGSACEYNDGRVTLSLRDLGAVETSVTQALPETSAKRSARAERLQGYQQTDGRKTSGQRLLAAYLGRRRDGGGRSCPRRTKIALGQVPIATDPATSRQSRLLPSNPATGSDGCQSLRRCYPLRSGIGVAAIYDSLVRCTWRLVEVAVCYSDRLLRNHVTAVTKLIDSISLNDLEAGQSSAVAMLPRNGR